MRAKKKSTEEQLHNVDYAFRELIRLIGGAELQKAYEAMRRAEDPDSEESWERVERRARAICGSFGALFATKNGRLVINVFPNGEHSAETNDVNGLYISFDDLIDPEAIDEEEMPAIRDALLRTAKKIDAHLAKKGRAKG